MKKWIMVALVIAVALTGFVAARAQAEAAAGSKFGYVDLNRALNETNDGKAAKSRLEADMKAKKQKIEMMQNDLKKMGEELEKQKLILSADAMKDKQQAFQQKYMEFQKTGMEYEKQIAEANDAAIKPIADRLMRVVQQIGQSDGFTMIVPREMALYSPAGTDITDKVIAAFNSGKGK